MRKHVWLRVQKEDEQKRSRWRKVIYEFVKFPNLLPQPETADTKRKFFAKGSKTSGLSSIFDHRFQEQREKAKRLGANINF